jgi:hypothetical protein
MAKKKREPKPNQKYKMPKIRIGKSVTLMLGMDPGSRNFGISLVGLSGKKIKVYANSVLMHPVNDLIDFVSAREIFLDEIATWFQHEVKGIIGERFQTRGIGGPLIEQVSAMLALVSCAYRDKWFKLTTASTWKNKLNRRFDIDLKEIYPQVLTQPHQLDATMIAIYGLEEMIGAQIDYDLDDILVQIEATSLIDLRKKK